MIVRSITAGPFTLYAFLNASSKDFLSVALKPFAPNAWASFTKSVLRSSVVFENLPSKKIFCHCLTMPRAWLLKITIVTGTLYVTAVASSFKHIPKLPSPVIRTLLVFVAIELPIAAPRPNPIVPRPPDVIHVRLFLNLKNCAAQH